MEIIRGQVELETVGKYTPFHYVTTVFNLIWDMSLQIRPDKYSQARKKIVQNCRNSPNAEYVQDFKMMNELIFKEVKGKMKELKIEELKKCIESHPDLEHPQIKTHYAELDRVFIVFDRDWDDVNGEERTHADYRRLFNICKNYGYEILLTTPMFEFWLLLHHDGINMNAYAPELCQKNLVLESLRDKEIDCFDWKRKPLEDVKRISDYRMKKYYGNGGFETALKQSKLLPADLEYLLDHVGSNVGIKLESLLKHRGPPSPF